jgi:superoxide reductase
MKRREMLKTTLAGGLAIAWTRRIALAGEYFPVQVDEKLFQGINRAKALDNETGLEQLHVPVIKAPEKVRAGEPFEVEILVGKKMHPMGPEHWIEHVQLNIGNEPAGTVTFRSKGYAQPAARFTVKLDDSLKGKKASLVVFDRCNLHGLWEHYVNVDVA